MFKKGFTLVELLVVIAIIALLSTMVAVAVQRARDKSKNSRIISDMSQIRTMAEVLYGEGDYVDFSCTGGSECNCSDERLNDICLDIYKMNGEADLTVHTSPQDYCVSVSLVGSENYCIDSTGYSGGTTDCDSTNCTCASD